MERIQALCKKIVNEINQATMLQIVKEENEKKGYKMKSAECSSGASSFVNSKPRTRADRMMARDLKRYISELSLAKARAERRIVQLGGSLDSSGFVGFTSVGARKSSMRELAIASSQNHVLPASLSEILASNEGFKLLFEYLEGLGQDTWCKFWKEVQLLKQEPNSVSQYRRADQIYHEFVHYCTDSNFKLAPQMCDNLHQYVLGNATIHAFFEAQCFVSRHMERTLLPGFLVTSAYKSWASLHEEEMTRNRNDGFSLVEDAPTNCDENLRNLNITEDELVKLQVLKCDS